MLSGTEIKRQRELGNIVIDPWDESRLNPNSYDLSLGPELLCYDLQTPREGEDVDYWNRKLREEHEGVADGDDPRLLELMEACVGFYVLDMAREPGYARIPIPEWGLILEPGRLYLGSTAEYTETRGFVPVIEGRSSVARLGMMTHLSAGFGDAGFRGAWTLEITVVHPLRVYAGARVCQIAYDELTGDPTPYAGKYQGQRGPQPSRMWRDFLPKG